MALLLMQGAVPDRVLIVGLAVFGVLFAINSSLHSYLIVSYASEDGVSLEVGFYYMANALGRLVGTVLSGWVFQVAGIGACLWISAAFFVAAAVIAIGLPRHAASLETRFSRTTL
jgi:predicted MFS family arabinose efflux permease